MTSSNEKPVDVEVVVAVDVIVETSKAISDAVASILGNTEVGNTMAQFDSGNMDRETIAKESGERVVAYLIGALCYNIIDGQKRGVKQISEAEDQLTRALYEDERSHNEQSAERVEGRLDWLARMEVQQVYRAALEKFVRGVYLTITDKAYEMGGRTTKVSGSDLSASGTTAAKLLQARGKIAS